MRKFLECLLAAVTILLILIGWWCLILRIIYREWSGKFFQIKFREVPKFLWAKG